MKESYSWANKIFTLFIAAENHHSFSQTNQNQNGGFVHACCGFCLHENGLETYVFFCYWLACWKLSHLVFELFRFELGISLLFIGCSLNILNNLGLFWFWIIMGCVGVTWLSRPSDSRRVRARSWLGFLVLSKNAVSVNWNFSACVCTYCYVNSL